MNICISICGIDFDFEKSYNLPKPFVPILGKPMINWIMDNLNLQKNDSIYIVYPSSIKNDLYFRNFQNDYNSITYIEINHRTKGPIETFRNMFQNTHLINMNNKCIIIDCDTIFFYDILTNFRSKTNNLLYYFIDNDSKPIYSYISIDSNQHILQIKEKEKISNYANCGCYCFRSTKKLKEYLNKSEGNYLSSIVQEMIGRDEFDSQIIYDKEFVCVGTPNLLKIFCSQSKDVIPKRFCFQLEKSLVINSQPIEKNIKYVKYLKSLGHTIIINTHLSNKGKEGNSIYKLLEKSEIPYDELYINELKADYYIGNDNFNFDNIEKRTGFYQTEISERFFNSVETNTFEVVVKKSQDKSLKGEIYWYQNIPINIKTLFPMFITSNEDNTSYTMEKINGISASYLFTKNSLTKETLKIILETLCKIHDSSASDQNVNIYSSYSKKLKQRYETYDYSKFPNSKEKYEELINYFEQYEKEDKGEKVVIHGDPVFTNIIIDQKSNVKFFDMRGLLGDTLTLYGDKWYDYGKIYQSLIGYDHILQGTKYKDSELLGYFQEYITNTFGKEKLSHIQMITKSLIFSLIPLHKKNQMKLYKLVNLTTITDSVRSPCPPFHTLSPEMRICLANIAFR